MLGQLGRHKLKSPLHFTAKLYNISLEMSVVFFILPCHPVADIYLLSVVWPSMNYNDVFIIGQARHPASQKTIISR